MPRSVRFLLALAGLLVLISVPPAAQAAGEGRLLGTVVDETGAPLPDVLVTVTREGANNYKQEKKSDKRGQFTIIVLDATVSYKFTLTKEGFLTLEQDIKLKLEDTMRQGFTLTTAKAVAPKMSAEEVAKLEGKNQAIAAFNEGVAAFNVKDMGLAAEKFRQAIELDDTRWDAYLGYGLTEVKLGHPERSLEFFDRALAVAQVRKASPANLALAHYNRACAQVAMGDKKGAVVSLKTAVRVGGASNVIDWLTDDPDLNPLRTDPEFKRLLNEAKAQHNRKNPK